MAKEADQNAARLWTPDRNADVTLFKGSFTTFSYDRHTHDEYAIGVIERGVQHFSHKGASYDAGPGTIISVNPDEVHDGEPGGESGYRYRMAYIGLPYLHALFGEGFDRTGLRCFSGPTTQDPVIALRLDRAMRALEQGRGGGVDQVLGPVLLELFLRHASPRPVITPITFNERAVHQAVERIHAAPAAPLPLEELAFGAAMSKFHFLRQFKQVTGLTPHAYALQLRVRLARKAMEAGDSPATAAEKAGFADQSHLTRRFKRAYGVTPGAFAKGI